MAIFKRSRCHRARMYWSGFDYRCGTCNRPDRMRIDSQYWRKVHR